MIERIKIVSKDFSEAFEGMNYESLGRLFMAVIAYANDKDPKVHLGENVPALTLYPVLKTHIERQEEYRAKMSNNGKKGGAPVGNSNATKTTKNNLKQPNSTKNNQKQPPILSYPILSNPNNNKKTYGECQNVKLTDEEYKKICDKGYTELIDELSLYLASKGDKYKSHYATILQWAKKREKDKSVVIKETPFNTGYMRREQESNDELERKFIKNL